MAQEIADSKLIDTWSSDGLKVKPDISKIIEGWQLGEQPPHEYMNWLQNTFGSKLNHILKNGVASWNNTTQYLAGSSVQHSGNVWLCKVDNTNSEPTDANANWKRIITVEALDGGLLNGYVDTTTNQTIAGIKTFSSPIVGSINGNSASATKLATARTINGVSFDGTANITVADSTAVKLTDNQTISDVKTFISSPIVPTPTTANQAVNKDYADSKIALTDFVGANQKKATSGYQKLPGGLIIQWGISSTAIQNANGVDVIFPITFPNAICGVCVALDCGSDTLDTTGGYRFATKSGVRVINNWTNPSIGYSYLALGY